MSEKNNRYSLEKNPKMFYMYIYVCTWKFSAINVQILSWITVYLSDSNTFVSHDCVAFTWEPCAQVRLELCQIGDSFCSKWRLSWLRVPAMQFELTERCSVHSVVSLGNYPSAFAFGRLDRKLFTATVVSCSSSWTTCQHSRTFIETTNIKIFKIVDILIEKISIGNYYYM